MSDYIPYNIMDVITYPGPTLSWHLTHLTNPAMHKSHNPPTLHHFVTELGSYVHISVSDEKQALLKKVILPTEYHFSLQLIFFLSLVLHFIF